jgi:uncharacterized protein YdhG (YjbR/CyaY superfamily)
MEERRRAVVDRDEVERDGARAVDEYLAKVPRKPRAALQKLRRQIRAAAPEASESIAYGMPTFRHRVGLVAFRAVGGRCSFHVMSPAVTSAQRADLEGLHWAGATIHFTPDEPLPDALVKNIVRARIEENEAARAPRAPSKAARGSKRRISRKP